MKRRSAITCGALLAVFLRHLPAAAEANGEPGLWTGA